MYSQLPQQRNRKKTKNYPLLREFCYRGSGFALKSFSQKNCFSVSEGLPFVEGVCIYVYTV